MKKVVVALALASVGFSPVFATEAVAPKTTDAKKPATTEEQAAQPAASQVKKEGTFFVAGCDCGCTASEEKKEAPKQEPVKTQKVALSSGCTACDEKKEAPKQEQPAQVKTQKVALSSGCTASEEKKEAPKQEPAKTQKVALISCCATSEQKKEMPKQEQPVQDQTKKVALA